MFAGRFALRSAAPVHGPLGQPREPIGLGTVAAAIGLAAILAWAVSEKRAEPAPPRRRRLREPVVVGRADPAHIAEIGRLVDKYMAMLRISGPPPVVRIRNNLVSRWLGLTTYRWSDAPGAPPPTIGIDLQRTILGHQRTLERVVAHEMIHYRDYLKSGDALEKEKAMRRLGLHRFIDEHDARFLQGAALVNAEMGPGFVTITSDQEDVLAKNVKPFFVLIEPWSGNPADIARRGSFGWSWAARLSPQASRRAARAIVRGARLVSTTDERWTRGPRMGKGRVSLPSDPEDAANLKALYDSGERADAALPAWRLASLAFLPPVPATAA